MWSKMITACPMVIVLATVAALGQQTVAVPGCGGCEFPVIMRQTVAAGKTVVGTRVEAKLVVATLVNGVVVPRDALLSGEVTESMAKSSAEPSRLAIRMDTAKWKNGSVPIEVYLTSWFYPEAAMAPQDLSYQPADASNSKRNWNGMGPYPDPNNPIAQQRFPGTDSDKDSSAPPSPASNISKHRVLMKNIEATRDAQGMVALTSTRVNIKLDKLTTYVFAGDGPLLPR